jgi:hypothetical protein
LRGFELSFLSSSFLTPRRAIDWDQRSRETRVQRWVIQTSLASENIVFLRSRREALARASFVSTVHSLRNGTVVQGIEISPRGTNTVRGVSKVFSLRFVASRDLDTPSTAAARKEAAGEASGGVRARVLLF